MARARFADIRTGETFRLLDDRSGVVTQKLAKAGDKRAVIAGGVAWYDMHPDAVVEVTP
jgi:hypothetical protein